MGEVFIRSVETEELSEVKNLLTSLGLRYEMDFQHTLGAFDGDQLVGTCSHSGRVLKGFAVLPERSQEGIAAKLATAMTDYLFGLGIRETLVFTKPDHVPLFAALGYSEIVRGKHAALLEGGMGSIQRTIAKMYEDYLSELYEDVALDVDSCSSISSSSRSGSGSSLKTDKGRSLGSSQNASTGMIAGTASGSRAALVMNCNPFTLGHQYLIQQAAAQNEEVLLFVVEEDRSAFPYEVRLELIKAGTAGFSNVHVLPGGSYIISSATFPTYFLKKEDEALDAYTELDAMIFGKYIAPAFQIKKRYVGEEPRDPVTACYNEVLAQILPTMGIEVVCIPRKKLGNEPISASVVRQKIRDQDFEAVERLVPPTTMSFLKSDRAIPIVQRIRTGEGIK